MVSGAGKRHGQNSGAVGVRNCRSCLCLEHAGVVGDGKIDIARDRGGRLVDLGRQRVHDRPWHTAGDAAEVRNTVQVYRDRIVIGGRVAVDGLAAGPYARIRGQLRRCCRTARHVDISRSLAVFHNNALDPPVPCTGRIALALVRRGAYSRICRSGVCLIRQRGARVRTE